MISLFLQTVSFFDRFLNVVTVEKNRITKTSVFVFFNAVSARSDKNANAQYPLPGNPYSAAFGGGSTRLCFFRNVPSISVCPALSFITCATDARPSVNVDGKNDRRVGGRGRGGSYVHGQTTRRDGAATGPRAMMIPCGSCGTSTNNIIISSIRTYVRPHRAGETSLQRFRACLGTVTSPLHAIDRCALY